MQSTSSRPASPDSASLPASYILVTGASSGIGLATVSLLAQKGATVFGGIRNEQHGARLEEAGALPVVLDLADSQSIRKACEDILSITGANGLYALINNAGAALAGPLELLPRNDMEAQFATNVFGPLELTSTLLPLLRKAGAGARIVNVGSVSGRLATPFAGAYAASKHAMEAMTDTLRQELRPWGIHVINVIPGRVATPIWDKTRRQLENLLAQSRHSAAESYRERVESRMQRSPKEPPTLPTTAAATIVRAIYAQRPHPAYYVGWDARAMSLLGMLPPAIRDSLLRRL